MFNHLYYIVVAKRTDGSRKSSVWNTYILSTERTLDILKFAQTIFLVRYIIIVYSSLVAKLILSYFIFRLYRNRQLRKNNTMFCYTYYVCILIFCVLRNTYVYVIRTIFFTAFCSERLCMYKCIFIYNILGQVTCVDSFFFPKLVSMTLFKVNSNSVGFEFIRLFDVTRMNSTNTINHVGRYYTRREKKKRIV